MKIHPHLNARHCFHVCIIFTYTSRRARSIFPISKFFHLVKLHVARLEIYSHYSTLTLKDRIYLFRGGFI